jgi:hypothetical protein
MDLLTLQLMKSTISRFKQMITYDLKMVLLKRD